MKGLALILSMTFFSTAAGAADKQVTVLVDGMTCPSCAASIEKHLMMLSQVRSVDISLAKRSVTIFLKDGSTITDSEIFKAIQDAGYKVKSISGTSDKKGAEKKSTSARSRSLFHYVGINLPARRAIGTNPGFLSSVFCSLC